MSESQEQMLHKLDAIIGLLSHRIVMAESGEKRKDAEKLVVKILKSAKIPSKNIAMALGKTENAVNLISSRLGK